MRGGRRRNSSGRSHQAGRHGGRLRPSGSRRCRGDPNQPIRVFTSQFETLHASTQAARNKVHKPACDCPPVAKILRHKREYVDPSHQENEADETELLNGLVVMPQIKTIRCIYLCLDTNQEAYAADPVQAELKLQHELFEHHTADYKVSCAPCLLNREPNGFACVSSTCMDTISEVCETARLAAREKEQELHPDHAHYLVTLPRSVLARLWRCQTRSQARTVQDELYQHLSTQGVLMQPETASIVLGHHLTSLLGLTNNNNRTKKDDDDDDDKYWLVMVHDHTDHPHKNNNNNNNTLHWSLDLPGGKRHLGETAMEAAVRETTEETSLVWNVDWVQQELQSKKASEQMNRFFLLTPPRQFPKETEKK